GIEAEQRERLVEEKKRWNRASRHPLTRCWRSRSMLRRASLLLSGILALLGSAAVHAADLPPAPAGPAYQIVLRSRKAEVTPLRLPLGKCLRCCKEAQTGGGSILVEQPEPNTIVILMAGSAVAGSTCCASAASITFNLEQDLEIVPLRTGL